MIGWSLPPILVEVFCVGLCSHLAVDCNSLAARLSYPLAPIIKAAVSSTGLKIPILNLRSAPLDHCGVVLQRTHHYPHQADQEHSNQTLQGDTEPPFAYEVPPRFIRVIVNVTID